MKMTMHIDEDLLTEVMTATGTTSKTAAVDAALRKVANKFRQRELWKKGLGMTPDELGACFDPNVALAMSVASASMIAEPVATYGRKHSR